MGELSRAVDDVIGQLRMRLFDMVAIWCIGIATGWFFAPGNTAGWAGWIPFGVGLFVAGGVRLHRRFAGIPRETLDRLSLWATIFGALATGVGTIAGLVVVILSN